MVPDRKIYQIEASTDIQLSPESKSSFLFKLEKYIHPPAFFWNNQTYKSGDLWINS